MKNYKEIPLMVNYMGVEQARRAINGSLRIFENSVFPVLYRFGLFDDDHIRKYICCATWQSIYEDAVTEKPDLLRTLHREAMLRGDDLWRPFRDNQSPVETPEEDGFIFKDLPGKDSRWRNMIKKAVTVQYGYFSVDENIIYQSYVFKPTQQQQDLYRLLYDFCEDFKKKNYKKDSIRNLLVGDVDNLTPSIIGVMGDTHLEIAGED